MSHAQPDRRRRRISKVFIIRQRLIVWILTMARTSSRALPNQGNKNGPWRTVESSLRRATDWELPPGIHGPNYFLEQGRALRENSRRNHRSTTPLVHRHEELQVEVRRWWHIPNPDSDLVTNLRRDIQSLKYGRLS